MSAWQPIETAPKDGTRVLIVTERGTIVIAGWADEASFSGCQAGPGWQVFDVEDCWYSWAEKSPTHWMTLPAPPDSTSPQERG
jgi:hypothetical protein